MITSTSTVRVRYAETDQMGIVYHANYFAWFELTRIDMLDRLGYPYKQMEAEGYLLPVLEIQAKYLRPARFDDIVAVTVMMKEAPRLKFTLEYTITHPENGLLVEGYSRHAFIDAKGRASKPPPRFFPMMQAAMDANVVLGQ